MYLNIYTNKTSTNRVSNDATYQFSDVVIDEQ